MRKRVKTEGFTLIELLVVIAIVAVLAAILFPVFITVKRSSYQAACSSNLKQFGGAFTMYANDWGGRLPLPGGAGGCPSMFWLHSQTIGESRQVGALWPYIRSRLSTGAKNNFWSCPMAVAASTAPGVAGYSPGQNYIMNDYVRTGFSGNARWTPSFPGYLTGLMLGACPRPQKVILLYEGVQDADGYCARLGSPFYIEGANDLRPSANKAFVSLKYANLPQNYHNGKCNFLFLDGHVRLMEPRLTLSQASLDSTVGTVGFWKRIYAGCGDEDLWNPRVPGVVYP